MASRLLVAFCLWMVVVGAWAEEGTPSWRTTLEQDLHGPAVHWTGVIVSAIRDGDYTCFVMQRVFSGEPFAACNPGVFDPVLFGAGQALVVKGNLGAARERKIGDETFSGPMIAAAFIERTTLAPPLPPWWYDDPFYYPYGYHRHWGIRYWY